MKQSFSDDRLFNTINYTLLVVGLILLIYPLYYVVIASFSDPQYVNLGEVFLVPRGFTLEGYQTIIRTDAIARGYLNSILYTALQIGFSVSATTAMGYALAQRELFARRFWTWFVIIPMFVNGGLIPLYLQVRNLGLIGTFWPVVLVNMVIVYNLIVARTFFSASIPKELIESARIDGCDQFGIFFRIVVPTSTAIIAVLTLWYGLTMWNDFFWPLVFLHDREMWNLQLVLREILLTAQVMDSELLFAVSESDTTDLAGLIRFGSIVVSSLPLLILYPFLQRYFVQGVMIGSLKG